MNHSSKISSEYRPWPGLTSYSIYDSKYFLGRSKEITELTERVINEPFNCVYGPSGVGKSSLLQAGLGNSIQKYDFFPVFIRLNHQNISTNYIQQTIDSVIEKIRLEEFEIEEVSQSILNNKQETLWEFFHRHIFWNKRNHLIKPLLVFDQFEEIFTLANTQSNARNFIRELGELAENTVPEEIQTFLRETNTRLSIPTQTADYRIIISLREDFLAQLEMLTSDIPAFRRNRYAIKALNGEQALEVINIPGEKILDNEVAEEIINAISISRHKSGESIPLSERTVEPAILSLFCRELNEQRINEHKDKITVEQVRNNGGNIIHDFYFNSTSSVSSDTKQFVEDKLLTESGYRNPVAMEDILASGIEKSDIDQLVNLRLIRIEDRHDILWVEFSHDILTREAFESRKNRRNEQQLEKEKRFAEELLLEQRKQKRKNKILLFSIVFGLICVVFGIVAYVYYNVYEYEEYYGVLVKKWGHFEGREQLTKDEASHRSYYYKMTKKGKGAKYFTKIYALNGYHKLTTAHNLVAYLLNQFDDSDLEADATMKEKLKSVCWWEMVFDASGEFVVQERAYDINNEVVYCFNNTSLINGKVMSFYSDENGLPIKLRKSGANYILRTYDNRGFEVCYEFYDMYGYPQPNKDNSYKTIADYNDDGLRIMEASLDFMGNKMIDRFGNCGYEAQYDNYKLIRSAYYNEKWQPCKTVDSVSILEYTYDKWGNLISASNFDSHGKPCIDKTGTHKYINIYNERGQIIDQRYYGINGKLKKEEDRIAIVKRDYDKNGNEILFELYDANNKYINNIQGMAKQISEFSPSDKLLKQITYSEQNGTLIVTYRMVYDAIKMQELIYNKSIDAHILKKYDKNGNLIYWAHFDNENKNPVMRDGYHCAEYKYTYKKKSYGYIETYKDTHNKLIDIPFGYESYSQKEYEYDSINNANKTILYNSKGMMYANVQELDDKGYVKSQVSIGYCDMPVRRNGSDGSYYYKANVSYNLQHSGISIISGTNEFNEPSYIVNDSQAYCINRTYYKNDIFQTESFDESRKKITDMENFKGNLPFAIHCEIESINNIAYKAGLRDGDILISYGNWRFSFENPHLEYLISEIERLKEKEKEIKVMRHFPKKLESKTFTYSLPKGLIGIRYTSVFYTQIEKNRLKTVLANGYWVGK